MRSRNVLYRICGCVLLAALFALVGCSDNLSLNRRLTEMQEPEIKPYLSELQESEKALQIIENIRDEMQEEITAPTIVELALTRHSPCSTFKIISSLIALEYGIIEPVDSVHTWSGEIFWNEKWNQDIDFSDAFQSSCVWYFREVIDEVGADVMEEELKKLQYGNCDISDWEGHLNTNNNNPALTGFWIESSLLISPKEQVEVMERIFGEDTVFSRETIAQLKKVMLLEEQNGNIEIYGKTGMGKAQGIVVDSWFTGFADTEDKRIYFCVYLGETDDKNVSSVRAKEIAVKIVSDYMNCTGIEG